MADRDAREEQAHGGLLQRDGDMVTLSDGARWWLNGEAWARAAADLTIVQHRISERRIPNR